MKDASYDKRVYWYNEVIEEARKASLNKSHWAGVVVTPKRKEAIKKVLTKAIVNLERTLNYQYDISRDPDTEKRIDEISEKMARNPNLNDFKRKGEGEIRRTAIKNTVGIFDDESPSDFFDKRHQAIVKRQEELGIPYRTTSLRGTEDFKDLPKKKGTITPQEKRAAEKEVLADLKMLAENQNFGIIDVGYKGRVKWHNSVIDEAIKKTSTSETDFFMGGMRNRHRVTAIQEVLTKRTIDLEKMVNPDYKIDETTEKRIATISEQMAATEDLNDFKRKDRSETRSGIVKFFNGVKNFLTGGSESPADFLDSKFQDVAARLKEKNNQKAIELRKEQPGKHRKEEVKDIQVELDFQRRIAMQSVKHRKEQEKKAKQEYEEKIKLKNAKKQEAKKSDSKKSKPTPKKVKDHIAASTHHPSSYGEITPPSTPTTENARGRSSSRGSQARGSRSSSPADWW